MVIMVLKQQKKNFQDDINKMMVAFIVSQKKLHFRINFLNDPPKLNSVLETPNFWLFLQIGF